MLKKIKELRQWYNEWCLEEVNIDFGFYHLSIITQFICYQLEYSQL